MVEASRIYSIKTWSGPFAKKNESRRIVERKSTGCRKFVLKKKNSSFSESHVVYATFTCISNHFVMQNGELTFSNGRIFCRYKPSERICFRYKPSKQVISRQYIDKPLAVIASGGARLSSPLPSRRRRHSQQRGGAGRGGAGPALRGAVRLSSSATAAPPP